MYRMKYNHNLNCIQSHVNMVFPLSVYPWKIIDAKKKIVQVQYLSNKVLIEPILLINICMFFFLIMYMYTVIIFMTEHVLYM